MVVLKAEVQCSGDCVVLGIEPQAPICKAHSRRPPSPELIFLMRMKQLFLLNEKLRAYFLHSLVMES